MEWQKISETDFEGNFQVIYLIQVSIFNLNQMLYTSFVNVKIVVQYDLIVLKVNKV